MQVNTSHEQLRDHLAKLHFAPISNSVYGIRQDKVRYSLSSLAISIFHFETVAFVPALSVISFLLFCRKTFLHGFALILSKNFGYNLLQSLGRFMLSHAACFCMNCVNVYAPSDVCTCEVSSLHSGGHNTEGSIFFIDFGPLFQRFRWFCGEYICKRQLWYWKNNWHHKAQTVICLCFWYSCSAVVSAPNLNQPESIFNP